MITDLQVEGQVENSNLSSFSIYDNYLLSLCQRDKHLVQANSGRSNTEAEVFERY